MNDKSSNPTINDYTRNLTEEAEAGSLEMPLGRDKEIKEILDIVSTAGKSNVLLLGPPGCGKTALAEGVACKLVELASQNQNMFRNKLIELNLTALNAGAVYVGQFEERVNYFLHYIKQDPSIIVFIDEIHMVMGFGKTSDSGASRDFANILKPSLASGEICCIGATTINEYERYIKSDGAFSRRFQIINLNTLNENTTAKIIEKHALKLKFTHGIKLSDQTIQSIISVSEKFFPDRYQPDKAIDVLRKITAFIKSSEKNTSFRKRRSIDAYLDVLSNEIAAISKNDFSSMICIAQNWLGVSEPPNIPVDLDINSLQKLLSPMS
jgi:ATP-dependent Clp protease ATP-binding subunit ClpC